MASAAVMRLRGTTNATGAPDQAELYLTYVSRRSHHSPGFVLSPSPAPMTEEQKADYDWFIPSTASSLPRQSELLSTGIPRSVFVQARARF